MPIYRAVGYAKRYFLMCNKNTNPVLEYTSTMLPTSQSSYNEHHGGFIQLREISVSAVRSLEVERRYGVGGSWAVDDGEEYTVFVCPTLFMMEFLDGMREKGGVAGIGGRRGGPGEAEVGGGGGGQQRGH